MTELDLTKLREIAEAATPGPWEVGVTTFGDPNDGPTHSCVREAGSEWFDHVAASEGCDEADLNMAHIAAFDPPTVLELIDKIERLRTKNIQLGLQATTAEHDRKLAYRAMDSANAKAGSLAEQVRAFGGAALGGVRYADRPRVDCEIERLDEHDREVTERARLDYIETLTKFLQSEKERLAAHGGATDPMLGNYLGGISTAVTELHKAGES